MSSSRQLSLVTEVAPRLQHMSSEASAALKHNLSGTRLEPPSRAPRHQHGAVRYGTGRLNNSDIVDDVAGQQQHRTSSSDAGSFGNFPSFTASTSPPLCVAPVPPEVLRYLVENNLKLVSAAEPVSSSSPSSGSSYPEDVNFVFPDPPLVCGNISLSSSALPPSSGDVPVVPPAAASLLPVVSSCVGRLSQPSPVAAPVDIGAPLLLFPEERSLALPLSPGVLKVPLLVPSPVVVFAGVGPSFIPSVGWPPPPAIVCGVGGARASFAPVIPGEPPPAGPWWAVSVGLCLTAPVGVPPSARTVFSSSWLSTTAVFAFICGVGGAWSLSLLLSWGATAACSFSVPSLWGSVYLAVVLAGCV